jgi:hypothetical protein
MGKNKKSWEGTPFQSRYKIWFWIATFFAIVTMIGMLGMVITLLQNYDLTESSANIQEAIFLDNSPQMLTSGAIAYAGLFSLCVASIFVFCKGIKGLRTYNDGRGYLITGIVLASPMLLYTAFNVLAFFIGFFLGFVGAFS